MNGSSQFSSSKYGIKRRLSNKIALDARLDMIEYAPIRGLFALAKNEDSKVMGREVRRVPADWEHPKDDKGYYIPLMGGSFSKRVAEWDEGKRQWDAGFRAHTVFHDGGGWSEEWVPKDEHHTYPYSDWAGARPEEGDYMPDWPDGQRTHWQMYEDTSEGTPISPVMETPEELARWLADNEASAFGSDTATYEQWLATIKRGFACSAVLTVNRDGTGTMQSGVEALADR